MATRTIGAIATRPTGDGSYNFISLSTGRVVNRRSFTKLPLPEDAITRVHHLARRAKAARNLTFTNCDNIDLDTLYADLDRDEDDLPLEDAETAGVDNDDEDEDDDSDYDASDDDDDEDYDPADDDTSEYSEDDNRNDADDNEPEVGTTGVVPNVGTTGEPYGETAGVDTEDATETAGVDNADEDIETAGVDTEDATEDQGNGVSEEDSDTAGVRRSTRVRRPTSLYPESEYTNVTVSNGRVHVMNPRMFSNAAVKLATQSSPSQHSNSEHNMFATVGGFAQVILAHQAIEIDR